MADKIKGITVEIGGDTTGLGKALQDTNKEINATQRELKEVEKLLKLDPTNTTLLAQKQELLGKQVENNTTKLDALKQAKDKAEKSGDIDKNTKEYRNLERQIVSTEQALSKLGDEADKSGKDLQEMGSKADKLKSTLSGIGGVIGNATKAIAGIGVAGATALVAAEASTREYRTDLSKLETNANQTGMSFENMKGHLQSLVAITDETDSSIEALSNLMQTGMSESAMEEVLNGLSGAIISFPDTLKIESLADGLQETLATGQATGQFGELLERCGMSLDTFNEGLSKASKAGKSQEYILETLAKTGMADVNAAYLEANANLITMKEAQFQLNDAMAKLGEVAQPAIAGVMSMVAEMTKELVSAFNEGGLNGLANGVGNAITKLLVKITEKLPDVVKSGISILQSLISGLQDNLPMITTSAVEIVSLLLSSILTMLPQILQMGIDLIVNLALGIAEQLPILIPLAIEAILNLVTTLLDNIDLIINAGLQLILGLATGLTNSLPVLIEKIPVIIDSIINALIENAPTLAIAALQIIVALVEGVIKSIPELLKAIPKIIESLVNGFKKAIGKIKNIGKMMIQGIFDGISNATQWLYDKLKGWVNSVMDFVKDLFGIESPSKLFRDEIGKNMALGIGVGFGKTMPGVISDMESSLAGVTDTMAQIAIGDIPGPNNKITTQNFYTTKHMTATTEVVRQPTEVVLEVDKRVLGRVVVPAYNRESNRIGVVMA